MVLLFVVIFFSFLIGIPLPARAGVFLPVPFTSQAPFGNWKEPYQSFCEEASVVMAAHFRWGLPITPEIADLEMRIIESYENLVYGNSKDTSVEETAGVLRTLYGMPVRVELIRKIEDMTRELERGNLLIVPVIGRMLANPYYSPPGPLYHMLVVRGYDDAGRMFITNDPGTRRGNSFRYRDDVLFNAIHDIDRINLYAGRKVMMVMGR